ncbi:MAG: riboflavin biosynthesis protein RibF [Oscillospiraceae bacterium]|nr:riboflavin biosynthesis protein RibF [Oscillospiraceae bacterium]
MCEKASRAAALGYFDGLHLAHIKVISAALKEKENGLSPCILLFDESPAKVLAGINVPKLISNEDREAFLRGMGLEIIKIKFSEIKDESPEKFVSCELKARLGIAFISCGYNYTFGKNGAGNAKTLNNLCNTYGIGLSVCGEVTKNGETVSSTAIRNAVKSGDMKKAVNFLGRPLSFVSPVFSGDSRGRLLGFPTINQYLPEDFIVPKFGVYASIAEFDGKKYPAVTNIGSRPTFGGENPRSETHIIGFSGDLYSRNIRIGLIDFIRGEKKFPSAENLILQIENDAQTAYNMLINSNYF